MIKRLGLIALLVAGTLTACGKDEERPASSGDPTTTTTEATTTTTAAAASTTLSASEYAYASTNLRTFAPGALQVTLENGGKEEHQATIVRFKDGKTLADLGAIAESDPAKIDTVIDAFGGPNAVAPGGGSVTATQTLEAGDYFFMCFIPAPDGQPHAAKGMVAPFTIEGTAAGEAPAASESTVVLKEYAFGADEGGVAAGTYTFENEGEQLHEATIYAPAEGKTTQDIIDFFGNPNPSGPPPIVPSGGIAAVNAGSSVTTDLVAGEYVFMCFVPDKADGAPHFTKGMIQVVTVT